VPFPQALGRLAQAIPGERARTHQGQPEGAVDAVPQRKTPVGFVGSSSAQ
jgi:hypothetical protein